MRVSLDCVLAIVIALTLATFASRGVAAEACESGVPSGPLADAIGVLVDQTSSSSVCSDTRACPRAVRSLDAARLGLCKQLSGALSQLGSAVQGLERAGLLANSDALRSAVEGAAEAANQLVSEEREGLLDAIEELCSGVRAELRRSFLKPESSYSLAQTQLGGEAWSLALRALATAGSGFASVEKRLVASARRCTPPACRLIAPVQFTPGAPENDSLSLIPPDRGTVARYHLDGESLDLLGRFDGTISLRFDGLLRARVAGALDFPDLGGGFSLSGAYQPRTCLDPNGWVHYESNSESLTLRAARSASLRAGARISPATVSLPPLIFLPTAPAALVMRVGDRVVEPSFQVGLSLGKDRTTAYCSASHEVVAIEEETVPGGTFEAARVESTWSCVSESGPLDGSAVAWLASGVGLVEYHFTDSKNGLWDYELECVEVPETAGLCTLR